MAVPLAFWNMRKHRVTMPAPRNRVSRGLAVIRFQTMPRPEVMVVPASVSRLATVTELASEITSFTNWGF